MADNKKITPLNVPKVKRGVKGALTPGEQPEKEQTPIEKVISRELTKIVEDINFDAKFESIKTAIESRQSEHLLPILEKINDKLNPILGALYGVSNVNDNTNPNALLSKLGNLDPKLTMFGPIDSMLKSIYELLTAQINNKSSYKLEDLAIAVSAEIAKFLKEIDNRPTLENLTKTLKDMKSSILSNSSAENINRIYSQLEVISNLLSNNKTIDYTVAISDVATKINSIANAISSSNSAENKDDSKLLSILNGISSAISTMSKATSENIAQSTNVLKEVSGKLDLINTETTVVDNSLLIDELKSIKQILIDDIVANYKQKPNIIDYSDALNSINESIKNIVASNNNVQNVENNQINSTTVNELKSISESITNLASSIVTNNSAVTELQNINNAISELSTTITNSSSITEIANKLTEITEKMSIENINTNISSIEQSINNLSSSISTISEINTSISSVNESITELNKIVSNNTQNFTESIKQSVNEQINLMTENISSINTAVEHISNIESNITQLSNLVNSFSDVITNSNISQIENISNSIKDSISNIITENNSTMNSLMNEFTQSIETSIQSITSNLSNLTNIDNSSVVSEISNSLTTVSNTLNELTSNVTKLTNASNTNIANINDSVKSISTAIQNVSNIDKSIDNAFTSFSQSLNEYMSNVTNSSVMTEISNSLSSVSSVLNNLSTTLNEVSNSSVINDVKNSISEIINSINNVNNQTSIVESINSIAQTVDSHISEIVSNLTNIDNSSVVSEISNSLTTVSNTLNELTSNVTKLTNASNTNIANINDSVKSISTAIQNVSNIDKSIDNAFTSFSQSLNEYMSNVTNSSISEIKTSINNISTTIQDTLTNITNNILSNIVESIQYISKGINTDLRKSLNDISSNISAIKDKVILVKLPESNIENYDSIIESINDNTNSIIDIISEKFNDIIDPIKKLVNTNDFNLRTAQIIDAVTSYMREKEVNTTALQYNVNINASGLDKDTVEALIDLSKISTDSNDYLENLDNILSSLSNFEILNDIELDNKNIENIVDSINTLSGIKLVEDAFNPFSVDCLKYFIDTLGSIDLSTLNQFDEDSLKSISIITDTLSSFSNLKLENFNQNIQSLNVDEFVKLLNTLKDIPVYDKEDKTTMTAISDLFSAISSISGFDNNKFEDLSSNLRKMIRLTEKPTMFTKLKISDRGLIHILMHNIGEIAAETEQTFDNTKNIGKMLNLICSISQYDPKSFDNLKYISYILAVITSKDESYLYKAFKNIEEIGGIISGWDAKNSPVLLMGNQLKLINSLSSKIKLKDVSSLAVKSTIAWGAMYSLAKMFNYLKEVSELSKNTEEYIKTINTALVGINSIDIDKLSKLDKAIKSMIVSSYYLKALASIPAKEIDISKNVKALSNVIAQINNIEEIKNTKNLESIKESLKYLSSINMMLAVVGVTMPLAYLGAFAIETEVTILNKVIGKLNEGITAIDKNVEKNLNSFATIVVAASGLLLFGAFIGGYVLDNFGDILGFTAALSVFILSTIGAFNLATRGMEEASINANEFAKLLLISGGIMLLGGTIMTLYAPLVLGALAFSVTLGAFILLTIGAFNLASRNIDSSTKTAEDLVVLVGMAAGIMLIGGTLFALYPWLMATTLMFGVYLTAFVVGITYLFNWAGGLVDDATSGAEKFAHLVAVASISLLLGGFLFMVYPWMMLTTLLIGTYLTAFVVGVTFLFNMVGGSLDEAVSAADKFAILVGISALSLCLGGFLFQKYPWMMLTTLLFGVYLAAFVGAVVFTFGLASKFIERAEIDALNFAKVVGISAATMLIGGLFMLIPGMPLATLAFTGLFILFMSTTLLAYSLASKSIQNAKETAIGFGIVVLLTSAALLIGGGMLLAYPGLDIACLEFAGLAALFITTFGVSIWALSKIDAKSLATGEIALAGIAVLIAGFGYAFTFVAEAMQIMSQVNDPLKQLALMSDVFIAIGTTVAVLAAVSAIPGVAIALAIGEALLAGIEVLIWGMGKAMSSIAQSMADLDKIKNFDSDIVKEAIAGYVSIIPSLLPLANPILVIKMMAIRQSVSAMSEAIMDIATSVKHACDLKTSDGRSLTPSDFTLAAQNVKSVVTILGRSLIDVYKENKDIFSAGNIGDLLGMDTPFSKVAKSCSTMGQLITDISAGVKDFAELRMPIYDDNGQLKGYRTMNDSDFENAAKSVEKVVTCLGSALINVYKESPDMFTWELIGDNPFAIVSKSCSTLGQLITDISAGVKDFAELRMPIYDDNGQIKGYRTMTDTDFENAAISVSKVITCLSAALIDVYNSNPELFTDPSLWHTDADKTPFGMVTKALSGVGTLIKDSAIGIKEIAGMEVDFSTLEGPDGKVSKIISIIARSIMDVYDANPELFEDDSFWHTDPQKTPFGMVMQCLNTLAPFVKSAASSINDISKMSFKASDLAENGEIYLKTNRLVGVIPKAIIDLIKGSYGEYLTDDDYIETYENMSKMYNHFSKIISSAASAYNTVLKLDFKDSSIDIINQLMWKMLKALPETIIGELNRNKEFYSNTSQLDNAIDAFEMYNDVINQVAKAYNSIIKSLDKIGVSGNDTGVIDTITNNLNTMISKLSTAIKLDTVSLDAASVNTFTENISKYSSAIDQLAKTYSLVPEDLTKYDNVVKAIEGVNFKIAEIQNLEAFEREQQSLEKYIITLNNLDLTKVEALSNLMSIMNELATKLGALDNFTATLNDKISVTLSNLANQIKVSGDIINKADNMQKQRHEAIKASIKEIQSIMDQKLIVEVNHNEIQSNGGDFFMDSYDSGNVDNGNRETPAENNKPSIFERASNSITNFFGGNNSSTSKKNTSNVAHHTTGGIDYDRLRTVIMEAITQASGSGIDINRR